MPVCFHLPTISVLFIMFAAAVSSLETRSNGCPQDWLRYNQSCYFMYANSLYDWDRARAVCQQQNGDLAVPNSQGENDFIWQVLNKAIIRSNPDRYIWLGCTYDRTGKGRVECYGRDQGNYTGLNPWNKLTHPGCLVLKYRIGVWDLYNCTDNKPFMCERNRCRTPLHCRTLSPLDFGRHIPPYCLLGHAFKETVIASPVQCCLACISDPLCNSFNLSGDLCQLNNVTASQVDTKKFFMPVEDCAYYEYE